MIPRLMQLATGVDLVTAVVAQAAGVPFELRPRSRHQASIRFLVPNSEGLLTCVEGLYEAMAVPGVVEAACQRVPGSRLSLHGSFRDRIGHVIALGESEAGAVEAAEAGLARIRLVIQPVEG
jgi:biotin carboxylase